MPKLSTHFSEPWTPNSRHDDDRIEEQRQQADDVEVPAEEAVLDGGRMHRALGRGPSRGLEIRRGVGDVGKAADRGDRHDDGKQAPARHQDQLVANVLVGLQPDQQDEQAE